MTKLRVFARWGQALTICFWAGLALSAGAAEERPAAAATNAPAGREFSDFKIITDRNIFNQRRFARSSGAAPRETRRVSRVDSFTLVGTMSYEKGQFAFFEGSRSEYRAVLTNRAPIAGFQVTQIAPGFVKLAAGTNEVKLPVGMQLRREEDGPWKVGTPPEQAFAAYRPSTSSSFSRDRDRSRDNSRGGGQPSFPQVGAAQPNPAQPNAGDGPLIVIDPNTQAVVIQAPSEGGETNGPAGGDAAGGDDVLRRLMQRREQEINR